MAGTRQVLPKDIYAERHSDGSSMAKLMGVDALLGNIKKEKGKTKSLSSVSSRHTPPWATQTPSHWRRFQTPQLITLPKSRKNSPHKRQGIKKHSRREVARTSPRTKSVPELHFISHADTIAEEGGLLGNCCTEYLRSAFIMIVVQGIPGSILGPKAGYLINVSRGFIRSLQASAMIACYLHSTTTTDPFQFTICSISTTRHRLQS